MEDNHDSSRRPTSELHEVSMFEGAQNNQFDDVQFADINGSVFHQDAQRSTGPVQQPQQRPHVSYFKNSKGNKMKGSTVMTIRGDVYGSLPCKSSQRDGSELVYPVRFVILT
jgi:hypothetical protein